MRKFRVRRRRVWGEGAEGEPTGITDTEEREESSGPLGGGRGAGQATPGCEGRRTQSEKISLRASRPMLMRRQGVVKNLGGEGRRKDYSIQRRNEENGGRGASEHAGRCEKARYG